MALKDWKKNFESYLSIIFIKNDKKDKLFIENSSRATNIRKRWQVHNLHYKIDKMFKTKSQALKFAKEYMKKH